jgi:hypothetical protein
MQRNTDMVALSRRSSSRRRLIGRVSALGLLAMSLGCAARVVPPPPAPITEPQASWSIKAGPAFGDERELCRSDRDAACVIPASTATQPMSVVVSVYLYPAERKTAYSGAFFSEFVESIRGRGHETQVDYTIEPGKIPTSMSSSGRVTSVPGNYAFRIAMFATVPGHTDPHQFQQVIPVRVVAPTVRS